MGAELAHGLRAIDPLGAPGEFGPKDAQRALGPRSPTAGAPVHSR
jgi:hypothetical protein